jgi:hypothetical protein
MAEKAGRRGGRLPAQPDRAGHQDRKRQGKPQRHPNLTLSTADV